MNQVNMHMHTSQEASLCGESAGDRYLPKAHLDHSIVKIHLHLCLHSQIEFVLSHLNVTELVSPDVFSQNTLFTSTSAHTHKLD